MCSIPHTKWWCHNHCTQWHHNQACINCFGLACSECTIMLLFMHYGFKWRYFIYIYIGGNRLELHVLWSNLILYIILLSNLNHWGLVDTYIDGIRPKGPYPPLLAGYPQYAPVNCVTCPMPNQYLNQCWVIGPLGINQSWPSILRHICITQPQWVTTLRPSDVYRLVSARKT